MSESTVPLKTQSPGICQMESSLLFLASARDRERRERAEMTSAAETTLAAARTLAFIRFENGG